MKRTPEAIVELVKKHEDATRSRRDRMDADYSMWLLNELPPNVGNPTATSTGPVIGDGYKHYTSNEPRTYGDKVVSIAANARVIIRVRGGKIEPRPKRDLMNDKERFITGALASADDRLHDLLQPSLQDQLSWFAPIRGWVAVRALLRKRKDKSTFVDIQPLDPRNTFWAIGKDGTEWVCTKTMRTARDIKSIYGMTVEGGDGGDEDNGLAVYDFVDAEHHQVVTEEIVLEKATRHGSPRVPVWIGVVGAAPQITSNGTGGGTSADYGESIFAADRTVYAHHNFIMSVVLELMSRARSPGYVLESPEGNKSLDQDPYKSGSEVSLAKDREALKPLQQIETTKDAAAFAALVQGEMQRGSLPHSVYGELAFQLSGFAINSLRQGVASIINPTIKTMSAAYLGVANLLTDQYITGQFKAMEVSGFERNREYFSKEITPDQVKEAGGRIIIEVLPELPQDEPAKWQMAQLARAGGQTGVPLMADRTISEDILNRQDPDADATAVFEQMARTSVPMAQAFEMFKAAIEMEDEQLTGIWFGELERIMRDILLQNQAASQGGQNGAGMPPAQPGLSPSAAPVQVLGMPQTAPTPQAGPLVPTGTPRPGARNEGSAVTLDEMLLG
jgi:hypothetical protein